MIEMEDIPIAKKEYIAMVKTINQLRKEKQHLIDKACEWLDKEMEDYVERFNDDDVQPIVISGSYDYKKDFIEAFRKAMEEQQ